MSFPKRRRLSNDPHDRGPIASTSTAVIQAPIRSFTTRNYRGRSSTNHRDRDHRAPPTTNTTNAFRNHNPERGYENQPGRVRPSSPPVAVMKDDQGDLVVRRDAADEGEAEDEGDEDDVEHCAICLSPVENKTVITPCLHSLFCWECIRAWSDQSRKCPLCLGPFKELIYNIRSSKDFQTYHLLPLRSADTSSAAEDLLLSRSSQTRHRRSSITTLPRYALYGRPRQSYEMDTPTWREQATERALERRRFVYRHGLFAKHVASNRYTGFKPFGPDKLSNPEIKNKILVFVRRELQVFPSVDVSFLTTYLLSIAGQLDLRSAAAIRLLADFVPQHQAEHLAHEIVTFARSPFKDLQDYDRFVQYGRPEKKEQVVVPTEVDRPRFESTVADEAKRWEPQLRIVDRRQSDSRRQNDRSQEGAYSRGRGRGRGGAWDSARGGDRGRGRGRGRGIGIGRESDNGWGDRAVKRADKPIREHQPRSEQRNGYNALRHEPQSRENRYDKASLRRSRSKSFSRERSRSGARDDRSRSRTRAASRTRSLSKSMSRSRPSSRGRSIASSRARSRSRSIARSRSSSYERSSRSPLEAHFETRQSSGTPPRPSDLRSDPAYDYESEGTPPLPMTLSIMGMAPRKDTRDIEADVFSSIEAATNEMESTDPNVFNADVRTDSKTELRNKLQSKLMNEYRTALAQRSRSDTIEKADDRGGQLREMLKLRLKAEKGSSDDGAQRPEKNEVVDRKETANVTPTTTFSQETRMLLLARLEEEKRRTAFESAQPHLGNQSKPIAGAQSSPPVPEMAGEQDDKEANLRLALLAQRSDALSQKAGDMKEKLMRAKLLQAKRQREKVI